MEYRQDRINFLENPYYMGVNVMVLEEKNVLSF